MTPSDAVAKAPELEQLSPDELQAYLLAFKRRRRETRAALSLWTYAAGASAFLGAAVSVGMILDLLMRGTAGLFVGLLKVALACASGAVAAAVVMRARHDREQMAALIVQVHTGMDCAGCGYGLAGVPPVAERPVYRCPECGLVSPLPYRFVAPQAADVRPRAAAPDP